MNTTAATVASDSSHRKTNLVGLSRAEMKRALADLGEPAFRAKQLWHWVYHRGETDFNTMTTMAGHLRTRLAEHFVIERPSVVREQTSSDHSRKWLFGFPDGNEVETVFIPEQDRGAVCLSSQIGCSLSCPFCHTGTMKLVRNLSAGEIVGQFMAARDSYGEWPSPAGTRLLSNIVMMGMGEPLLNYDAVAKALKIIMDGEGIALSKRRITLSTSGVVPLMDRCGDDLGVNLAISLHAVTDELRDVIVPINRTYPIRELLAACRRYPGASNARRITFEYVMLQGINDSAADARELVRLVRGIPAKFNLIPFNPWPGAIYRCSGQRTMRHFADILNEGGFSAPVRVPRGRDILAACGQLKSAAIRDAAALRAARQTEKAGAQIAAG